MPMGSFEPQQCQHRVAGNAEGPFVAETRQHFLNDGESLAGRINDVPSALAFRARVPSRVAASSPSHAPLPQFFERSPDSGE